MFCPKCSSKNPADKKFCGDCGTPLEAVVDAVPVPGDPGAFFCARHKKAATRVRCGHCEAPICTKCAVYGPVGARCRQCARHRVAVRPMGVLHAAGKGLGETAPRAAWYLVIWSFVLSLFSHFFGGHHDA